jgi:hypothetical protein
MMTANPDTSGKKNAIQACASAIEYMKRYTLIGAFGLTTADTDIDGRMPELDIDKLHKQYMELYHKIVEKDESFRSPIDQMNFNDPFFLDLVDEERASKHIPQGSDEWDAIRLGRFTSSEIYKIMECGKRDMTPEELAARPKKGPGSKTTKVPDPSKMSQTGFSYIRKKVWETLAGRPLPGPYAFPLVYGKETEPIAVEYFEEKYAIKTEPTGFQVFSDHAGGSPDRLIGTDDGLEIKCPSSDEQIDYLMLTDHYDLKRCYPAYYWQCVSLMLFTNRHTWNFCTFDPRMVNEKHKMTRIVIEWSKVEEDIDAVIKALEGAVEEKLKLIKTLG